MRAFDRLRRMLGVTDVDSTVTREMLDEIEASPATALLLDDEEIAEIARLAKIGLGGKKRRAGRRQT